MRFLFISAFISAFFCLQSLAFADEYSLPEIGTAGITALSVQKETQLGQYFLRKARSSMPLINDPVMNEYLNSIGNRLLLSARDVRFPFTFMNVNNPTLNATAFLGGVVQVNSGLYHYAETEDQFASVLAHEISHVTLRHIARFIESQTQVTTLSTAGIIGAVVMSIINPTVGIAALSTTMGANIQSRINFTRDNEYEADRAGINLLARAGFNPFGMADMFRVLLSAQGNINPSFAMLIDHPLSEIRVSQAQSRAEQLGARKNSQNPNFYMAQARSDVRYMRVSNFQDLKQTLLVNPLKKNSIYINYALALVCYELKQYDESYNYLQRLHGFSNNLFVLDLLTDLDLATGKYQTAISRLDGPYKKSPNNEVLVLNLANAYLQSGQAQRAVSLLNNYTNKNTNSPAAWDLLSQSALKTHDRCTALQARGRNFALSAAYPQALNAFSQAMNYCSSSYDRDIVRALTAQTGEQRNFDESIEKEMH